MRSAAARACVEAAEAGAEVVRKAHRARAEHVFGIDLTGPIDLVTAVDHAAETAIVECLQRLQPAVPILAEERGMVGGSKTGCRFIVDPLDGTTNFAHGFPVFAVSIAYEEGCQEFQQVFRTGIPAIQKASKSTVRQPCTGSYAKAICIQGRNGLRDGCTNFI